MEQQDCGTVFEQKILSLTPRRRGFHLITDELIRQLPEIQRCDAGLLHLFLLHTSAALSVNENADPSVRTDLESWFNRSVAEDESYFCHTSEGSDDMPAHIKSSLLGVSLTLPVARGRLLLGTWQGIYLCEHRNHGGCRKIVATLSGTA